MSDKKKVVAKAKKAMPAVAVKPTATKKPVAAAKAAPVAKPVLAKKPTVVGKAAPVAKPVLAKKPAVVAKPAPTAKPVAPKKVAAATKPAPTKPAPTKKPAAAKPPAPAAKKLPAAAKSATVQPMPGAYSLVLKGARVIDPASGLDGVRDIAISNGIIAAIAETIAAPRGTKVLDLKGQILTPGLIDTHCHIYEHVTGDFGLNADLVGMRGGVTTVVDQGGPSALTIGGFNQYVVAPSASRVLCFISAYLAGGLLGHRYVDLYGPTGINVDAIVKAARENPGIVRGIKAHAEPGGYSRWGVESLKLAKKAGHELGLPTYVHLGTLWPEAAGAKVDPQQIINEVVPLLEAGDILAHPFTRYPSGFVNKDGSIHPLVLEALAKGVKIDVGRGAHFSFDNAKQVLAAGILPDTLGADLHGYNIKFPDGGRWYRGMFTDTAEMEPPEAPQEELPPFSTPYGIHHTMSELMALGVPLPKLVAMCTNNAATMLGMSDTLGQLRVGQEADISVFKILTGEWTLRDSNGVSQKATQLLHPTLAMRGTNLQMTDSPLLPNVLELAA
jgi:dihydroorotase